jgi:threonine/homoserine/homoserine lactone efflux protein
MFGSHDLLLFAATVFVLNATPGADLMLTLATTVRRGLRGGLLVATGICAGCVVHTLAAAFGLAALMATSAAAFTVIKVLGAAYLVWLALGMLRDAWAQWRTRGSSDHADAMPAAQAPQPWPRLFMQGFLTNALNPKVALFFLALLPQFIEPAAASKTAAFLFLGAWFIVQGWLFLAVFVLLVAPLGRWRPQARVKALLHAAGGGLFLALAARLAVAERGS